MDCYSYELSRESLSLVAGANFQCSKADIARIHLPGFARAQTLGTFDHRAARITSSGPTRLLWRLSPKTYSAEPETQQ